MVIYRRIFSVLVLLLFSMYVNAFDVAPYREAQLIKSQSFDMDEVEVPLSKIQRSGRGWEPESVLRVEGHHVTSLYKLNRNVLLDGVYSYYRTEMLKHDQTIIFECQGRNCGSSNAWANNFFKDYLLYGADQNQYLLVVETRVMDTEPSYQILYLNRRGAGDVMIRLEDVKSERKRNTEDDIVAQMDIADIPRIRRFIRNLPAEQSVIGFVTGRSKLGMTSIEVGDQLITDIIAGLGSQLAARVRLINLADLGRESLGMNRVSFVYVSR